MLVGETGLLGGLINRPNNHKIKTKFSMALLKSLNQLTPLEIKVKSVLEEQVLRISQG